MSNPIVTLNSPLMQYPGPPTPMPLGSPPWIMNPAMTRWKITPANGVKNDLKHTRGVLSMARTQVADSAGSQFFVMHADADYLDGQYAAFGKVIEGMDVVDEIASTRTDFRDKPLEEQKMKKVTAETFGVEYPEPVRII